MIKLGGISDNIFHLKIGNIYEIDCYKIFTMGGAYSHDKEHISWWKQEVPNQTERNIAIETLEKYNNTVDFIISHCRPKNTIKKISKYINTDEYCQFLETIDNKVNYKHWYFGHYHEDMVIDDKHTAVYDNIIKIKNN